MAVGEALDAAERSIRALPYEVACVFAADGSLVVRREGEPTMVDLSDIDPAIFAGATVTHNHPRGTSFSWSDVRFLLEFRPTMMRVVTLRYRCSLALPPETEWQEVAPLVRALADETREEHRDRILAATMTFEQSDEQFWHDVWTKMAEVRRWRYQREAWITI